MMSGEYVDRNLSESDDDETYPKFDQNVRNITQCNFELVARANPASQLSKDGDHMLPSRKGHTNWCICGKCKNMEREEKEENKIPEEYFGHLCHGLLKVMDCQTE